MVIGLAADLSDTFGDINYILAAEIRQQALTFGFDELIIFGRIKTVFSVNAQLFTVTPLIPLLSDSECALTDMPDRGGNTEAGDVGIQECVPADFLKAPGQRNF